jgi:hypothetical protein
MTRNIITIRKFWVLFVSSEAKLLRLFYLFQGLPWPLLPAGLYFVTDLGIPEISWNYLYIVSLKELPNFVNYVSCLNFLRANVLQIWSTVVFLLIRSCLIYAPLLCLSSSLPNLQHSLPHGSANLLITLRNLNHTSSVYSIRFIKLLCRDVNCSAFSSPGLNTAWTWIIASICRTPLSWPGEVCVHGQGHRIQLHKKNCDECDHYQAMTQYMRSSEHATVGTAFAVDHMLQLVAR